MRTMIFEGELRPGSRIAEQRLCARFGVSRTPLREALKVLSAEGLVRLLPNKGATVVRVTRKEVEEIIPVLGSLEAFAGELACANIDDARLTKIRAMHDQMIEHYERREDLAYIELNHAIHEAIFAAARNQTLLETYNMLQTRLRSLLSIAPIAPPAWAEAVGEHERMLAALETQDGVQFARIARMHIRHKADKIRQALDVLDARAESTVN
jgi:DNA-binding GntR family transcriptional regulator